MKTTEFVTALFEHFPVFRSRLSSPFAMAWLLPPTGLTLGIVGEGSRIWRVAQMVLVSTILALPANATTATTTLEWVDQLGTASQDASYSVSSDGLGNVYISRFTTDDVLGGSNNIGLFVSKYDANGSLLWSEPASTTDGNSSRYGSVSADGLGNVYFTGETIGTTSNIGQRSVFVSKYNADGTLLWTEQLGTSQTERSNGVSANGLGDVYISGYTLGSLEGANVGSLDAFVAKFSDPIPEPSTLLLGAMAFGSPVAEEKKVSSPGLRCFPALRRKLLALRCFNC